MIDSKSSNIIIFSSSRRDSKQNRKKATIFSRQNIFSRREDGAKPVHAKTSFLHAYAIKRAAKRIKKEELQVFAHQLSVLLHSGISLVASLGVLSQQTENSALKKVLTKVSKEIRGGSTFTTALSNYPAVFSELFISMIRAAEVGGQMAEVLKQLSTYLKEQDKLDKKLKSAIVYPKFVFVFFALLLLGIIFGLVPKFEDTFASFNTELPAATQLLLDVSRTAADYIIVEMIMAGTTFFFYKKFMKSRRGQKFADRIRLRLPLIGDLILKASISKFCRTLEILVQSGVSLVESLEIAGQTAQNSVFTKAVVKVKQSVLEGMSLASAMEKQRIFPPLVVKMVATGEESGALELMLKNIAELYDTHVDSKMSGLTSLIEPVLMIALGAIAIIVILALYLPIFNLGNLSY